MNSIALPVGPFWLKMVSEREDALSARIFAKLMAFEQVLIVRL
jgi:hypothetical protein